MISFASLQSYVGVWLLLALECIQTSLIAFGKHVGPIMTLSYKNHALDEFILDLIKFSPRISRGALIRVGKSDNQKLWGYGERNSKEEQAAQRVLERDFKTARNALRKARKFRSAGVQCMTGSHALSTLENDVTAALCIFDVVTEEGIDAKLHPKLLDPQTYAQGDSLSVSAQLKLAHLTAPASHWGKSATELLHEWLTGSQLPPICEHTSDSTPCNLAAQHNSRFCIEHTCESTACTGLRSSKRFCDIHTCVEPNCQSSGVADNSYCKNHVCRLCKKIDAIPLQRRAQPGKYCIEHVCKKPTCENHKRAVHARYCVDHNCIYDACDQQRSDGSTVCKWHTCAFDDCTLRKGLTSKFCTEHSCRICVANSSAVIGMAEDIAPRNTCTLHELCNFVFDDGTSCVELTVNGNSPYCIVHGGDMVKSQCNGTVKKKNRQCRALGVVPLGTAFFCEAHEDQQPVFALETDANENLLPALVFPEEFSCSGYQSFTVTAKSTPTPVLQEVGETLEISSGSSPIDARLALPHPVPEKPSRVDASANSPTEHTDVDTTTSCAADMPTAPLRDTLLEDVGVSDEEDGMDQIADDVRYDHDKEEQDVSDDDDDDEDVNENQVQHLIQRH